MDVRQTSFVRYVRSILDARPNVEKFKRVYEDEVPTGFDVPSLYVPGVQHNDLTGAIGYSLSESICTLVFYRKTTKDALTDAREALNALQVKRKLVPIYENGTLTGEHFRVFGGAVRPIEGGPTGVRAATLTVTWRAMIEQDLERGVLIQNVENEAFYRAEDVAGALTYEAASQTNEVKSPMVGQTLAGQDTL